MCGSGAVGSSHVVSVAEDEVLFFLKRDRRVLGGARAAGTLRSTPGHLGLAVFAAGPPGPWWRRARGSRSTITPDGGEVLHAEAPESL